MNPETLNKICKNTMIEHLGIEFIETGEKRIIAKMPVDERTIQPMKRLHGGAIMALAESVGSAGSTTLIDTNHFAALGVEICGSHVATTSEHEVWAVGTLIHHGRTRHVWDIRVEDKNGKLLSICRMTNSIVPVKH